MSLNRQTMSTMSIETRGERIPSLTLGWRMRMALGEMKAEEMAAQLGVSRQTLSRWMADKGKPPKRAYLAQWALITGVPLTWIESGIAPEEEPAPPNGPAQPVTNALADYTRKKARRSGASVQPTGSQDNSRYGAAA